MSELTQSSVAILEKAIDDKIRKSQSGRDTTLATVTRVDNDGTTWVHVYGGAQETPVRNMTSAASVGDTVNVVFSGLSCMGIGNVSSPAASQKQVEKVSTESAQAIKGVMDGLLQVRRVVADKVTAKELEAEVATINEALVNKASIADLTAATGRIGALEADTADIGEIRANAAKVADLDVEQLEADHAAIASLDANYAHADLANVNNAWIENGVIKDAAITNEMVGSLSANKLTAGTINGANINVTNLKADNITTGTLNGERIGQGSLSLDKLSEDVYTETEVDAIVEGLNDRIDGAIETHTGTVVPTLNNSPASAWNTADLKDEHVGDVYYVVNSQSQQNGYCYRFTKSGSMYSWQLIKDSDVTAALSRISTAEGKITTFDSDISTLKTDTGELKTKTQTLETSLGDKVDTSTFNELSSTVDGNSATITNMSTVLTNNGLTSSTNITQTVNSVSQTATSNSSTISQLVTTLGTNADGTTKAGDIVHRTSAVEQDLSGFKTTVSQNYASKTSVEDAQADATKALGRQVAYSATCSTAAGTAAKVATCTNFPTLAAGVTVTVRFSVANTTTGAITLNVNSTGAKTIYVNGAATAAGNQMLWASNANVTFTYDGTYWRVVSEPRTWYGTCATAAGTAAKAATINEVVVCKGTVVKLNMTYENTSTSATMNLTSTGAKNLYYGTTTTRPTTANGYGWGAASTATFVFDGQYWRVGDTSVLSRLIQAETTISSHTTSINQNAEAIALKANSSEVYTKTQTDGLISTEVTNRNAAITAKANEISASVSETYATKTALTDGIDDAKDYTDSEISSAKAEIKVTTDGISTEVAKKVGSSEIISKINQSAETVKIQASKVEIDGTAIFNSISSDVDSAITSKGYATTGQVATAKSEAISSANSTTDTKLASYSTTQQMNTAISTAVDNIDVGGRNMLLATPTRNVPTSYDAMCLPFTEELEIGQKYTVQLWDVDVSHSGKTEATTGVWVYIGDGFCATGVQWAGTSYFTNGHADHLVGTFEFTQARHDAKGGTNKWLVLFNSFPFVSGTMNLTVGSWKLERGNVATDWTPAPEDLEAYADAAVGSANMQEQTIYMQAVEGTLSVDRPSGWVDATSESVWYEYSSEDESTGAWTTPIWTAKRPTYRPEYPVTFVSTQRKRMDGTVESTLPLRDDTTTVIDGGHIVTGTIDANKVTVTNLNAGSINSGTLSAEYIDTEGLEISLTSVDGLTQALAGKASSSDLSGVQSDLSTSIATATGSLTDRIAQIDGVGLPEGETGSVDNLDKRVVAFENHISFKNVVVDETLGEQPAIVLEADKAAPTGNVSTVLTNSALMFQEDGQTVAEITNQQLEITKTKVSESMQLGGFMWIPLSDGSLAFKWV